MDSSGLQYLTFAGSSLSQDEPDSSGNIDIDVVDVIDESDDDGDYELVSDVANKENGSIDTSNLDADNNKQSKVEIEHILNHLSLPII